VVPAGTRSNLDFVLERTSFPDSMSPSDQLLLADAQTNGGLLAAVEAKAVPRLLKALASAGAPAAVVGEVLKPKKGHVPGVDVGGEISPAAAR
jgi:selenide,water dikinase